jgi:ABC-type antimicrobial peptide transport system permease subunit
VIGIYGMLAYSVRRGTAELGIRTALAANRNTLLSLVVGQAITMAAIGVPGASLAAALMRFIESQLYAVQPMDWVSFGVTAASFRVLIARADVLAGVSRCYRLG